MREQLFDLPVNKRKVTNENQPDNYDYCFCTKDFIN